MNKEQLEDYIVTLKKDFDKENYNPQHLMAERDIEREKLTEHEMYKDVLLKLRTMKSKDEKQCINSFIF